MPAVHGVQAQSNAAGQQNHGGQHRPWQNNNNGQHNHAGQNRQGKQGGHRRRSSAGNHGPNQPKLQRQTSRDSTGQQNPGPQNQSPVLQRSPPVNNTEGRRRSSNGDGQQPNHKGAANPSRNSTMTKATETTPTLIKNIPSLPPKPSTVVEAHIPKMPDERSTPASDDTHKRSEPNERSVDGKRSHDFDDRRSARNRTKSESSAQDELDDDDRPHKKFRRSSRERSRSSSRRRRDSDDLPPLDDRRSRSLQRRSSRSRSPPSRNSSISSRSSDLNSLEAELLGVSTRRPSADSEPRRRPERVVPTKAKRRKPTNSAFRYERTFGNCGFHSLTNKTVADGKCLITGPPCC